MFSFDFQNKRLEWQTEEDQLILVSILYAACHSASVKKDNLAEAQALYIELARDIVDRDIARQWSVQWSTPE